MLTSCKVINEMEKDICVLEWGIDRNLKQYSADTIVVRNSIGEHTIKEVAEMITGHMYNHPEDFQNKGDGFKFAFPLYGGAILEVKFTGEEVVEYDWFILKYQVALMVCSIVFTYWRGAFKRSAEQEMINERIGAISESINEEYLKAAEKYGKGEDIEPLVLPDGTGLVKSK